MSLMLTRRGIEALVGAALVVVLVAVLPAVAEAQSITTTQQAAQGADANPARSVVVVRPGDSLWSISAERLGGGATPQQVAKGAEQIYALNRDQIGSDPNLLIVGQKLSLPAAMGSREETRRPDAKATPPPAAREDAGTTAEAVSPKKTGHAISASGDEASRASRTAPRTPEAGLAAKAEKTRAPVGKTPSLPKVADDAPAVPAARQVASEDPPTTGSPVAPLLRDARSVAVSAASTLGESFAAVRAAADDRRTLGWTILALTILVGALMAWRLPMKRTTRWDAERWGIPTGYYGGGGNYTSNSGNPEVLTAKPAEESRKQLAERLTPAAHHSEALLLGEALQEHLHHHERSPAGVALAALKPTTNGFSEANGAGTEAPSNGALPNGGSPNVGIQEAAPRRRRESVV